MQILTLIDFRFKYNIVPRCFQRKKKKSTCFLVEFQVHADTLCGTFAPEVVRSIFEL